MLEKRPKLKKFLKYTFSFLKWGLVVFGFVMIAAGIGGLKYNVNELSKDVNTIKKENKELKARIGGIYYEITKGINSVNVNAINMCSVYNLDDMEILSEFSYLSEKKDKNYSVHAYKEKKGRCYFFKFLESGDDKSFIYKIDDFEIEIMYRPIFGGNGIRLNKIEEDVVVKSNDGYVTDSYMIIITGNDSALFNKQDLKNIAERVLKIDGVL